MFSCANVNVECERDQLGHAGLFGIQDDRLHNGHRHLPSSRTG